MNTTWTLFQSLRWENSGKLDENETWQVSPCRNSCFVWIVAPAVHPDWAHCIPYHHPNAIKDTKQMQEWEWTASVYTRAIKKTAQHKIWLNRIDTTVHSNAFPSGERRRHQITERLHVVMYELEFECTSYRSSFYFWWSCFFLVTNLNFTRLLPLSNRAVTITRLIH